MNRLRRRFRKWLSLRPTWVLAFSSLALVACGTQGEQAQDAQADVDVEGDVTGLVENAVYLESEWEDATPGRLPESAHPYRNNTTESQEVVAPGCARATRVKFERLELRSGDTVTLYDVNGRRVQTFYAGTRRDVWSNAVEGNVIKMRLKTNGSGTAWGYKVSAVQIVEGPMPCPRIAWLSCNPGYVAVQQPQAMCTCPQPPQCLPLASFEGSLGGAGGFTGGSNTWTLKGTGEILHTVQMTAGDAPVTEHVGWADRNSITELVSETHAARLYTDPLPSTSGNMTTTLTVTHEGRTASVSWPTGTDMPERAHYAVANLEKAITCGPNDGDAQCLRGFSCVEGRCMPAPSCACPRFYQPVCGIFGNTYGNTCEIACAGEALDHDGPCGTTGDTCGGLDARTCQDGFNCQFITNPDGVVNVVHDPHAEGTCEPEVACRCAEIFQPMCGTDGRTYGNPCELGCRGMQLKHEGACGAAGDTCNADSDCHDGLACNNNLCEERGCFCPQVYQPVCGADGTTYGNGCMLGCANAAFLHDGECGIAGDACGGERQLTCQAGFNCRYADGRHTAESAAETGVCRPMDWCDTPSDCGHTVRLACPATWFCEQNACRFECNEPPPAQWDIVAASFETPHPYANNARQGWTATGPEGTTAVRFHFSAFDTEANYDNVTLYDADWNVVMKYSGNIGEFTTVEVPGRQAHLVFTSDRSVTRWGFRGASVHFKH